MLVMKINSLLKQFSCNSFVEIESVHLPDRDLKAVYKAMLELIAEKGWVGTKIAEIASRSSYPIADLEQQYATCDQLMGSYLDDLLLGLFSKAGMASFTESVHGRHRDYLFDVFMCYFDLLQANRPIYLEMRKQLISHPLLAAMLLKHAHKLLFQAMTRANLLSKTTVQFITPLLLKGWNDVINCWHQDQTGDLSLTMKKLDQFLAQTQGYWNGLPAILRNLMRSAPPHFAAMHKSVDNNSESH